MRSLIVVALSLSVLAAAGCSGSDDADPTTPTSETAAPATTPTPPDTDVAATTATTTATTSAPPTTEAPTTTLDPTAALIADIEADLNAGEQAFLAAGADPSSVELRDGLSLYFSGQVLDRLTKFLDGLVSDGLRVRPNTEVPSVLQVYSVEATNDPENPTTATIEVCRIDAGVVYEPLPGGGEAIVDDSIANTVSRSTVELVDGTWRGAAGEAFDSRPEQTTCAR